MGVLNRQSGHKTTGGTGDSYVNQCQPTFVTVCYEPVLGGHRDPAFEEFTEQMNEQMMPELCDKDSGRDSIRALGAPKRAAESV